MEEISTYSNQKVEPLTIEELKKAADMITKNQEKALPKGMGWLAKFMAKFGWHREYEILIFDKDKFRIGYPYFEKPKLNINQSKEDSYKIEWCSSLRAGLWRNR